MVCLTFLLLMIVLEIPMKLPKKLWGFFNIKNTTPKDAEFPKNFDCNVQSYNLSLRSQVYIVKRS